MSTRVSDMLSCWSDVTSSSDPGTPGSRKERDASEDSASRRPSKRFLTAEEKFEKVMQKQVSRCAVTIKHTSVTKEEAVALFKPLCHFVRCGHELHKEQIEGYPDDHLHLYLQLSTQKRLMQIYKLIRDNFDDRMYGRPDVRQLVGGTDKSTGRLYTAEEASCRWNNYCKKEDDYLDEGELKLAGPARIESSQSSQYSDTLYTDALNIAEANGIEAAMDYARQHMPREYATRHSQLFEAFTCVQPKRKRYSAPSMRAGDVTLRPWQKHWLPRVMSRDPVRRRIHWVYGSPEQGKSFLHDYLEANHPCGIFNCTDRCGINDLAFQYDEEGVVMWDFPKNFDWDTMEATACSVIEKFSDFGTKLRSLKYKGKNPTALGHVVVFANCPCPQRLKHRDIKEFCIDDWIKQHPADTTDLVDTPVPLKPPELPQAPPSAPELPQAPPSIVPAIVPAIAPAIVPEPQVVHEEAEPQATAESYCEVPGPRPEMVLRHFPTGSFYVPADPPSNGNAELAKKNFFALELLTGS